MSASFAEHAPSPAESPSDSAKPTPTADRPPRIQYFAAFRYLFEQPDWLQSLLLASVAFMVPVFGTVALVGYYYEIVERIHRDPAARCPPFQFGRFALYCGRGVWTYLLLLAITSVLQPVLQIPAQYTIMGVIFAFASSAETGMIVATIAAVVWLFLFAGIWLGMMFGYQPLALRGGLSQELPRMFRLKWAVDFGKKMWLEILLTNLWMFVGFCVLLPLGLMMMVIGVLPMTVWLTVAGAHLTSQVYQLYLRRGGEPIPLRPAEAEAPPVLVSTNDRADNGLSSGRSI